MKTLRTGFLLLTCWLGPAGLLGQSAVLTENITDEADIRSGGSIITVEVNNDTLRTFTTGIAQDIIDGMSGSAAWNNRVVNALDPADVTRLNDSIFRITLPPVSNYYIVSDDLITLNIPSTAVRSNSSYDAAPQISVSNLNTSIAFSGSILNNVNESNIRTSSRTLVITADYNVWRSNLENSAIDEVSAMFTGSPVFMAMVNAFGPSNVDVAGNVLTVTFTPYANYIIGENDTINVEVAANMFVGLESLSGEIHEFVIYDEMPQVTLETVTFNEGDIRTGSHVFSITVSGDQFVDPVDLSLRNDFSGGTGWETYLEPNVTFSRISPTVIQVSIPATPAFQITAQESTTLQLSASHLIATTGGTLNASGSVSFTPMDPYLVLSRPTDLTERNIDEALVTVKLYENVFSDADLDASNFILTTDVPNLSIKDVYYFGPDSCAIRLDTVGGSDFDVLCSLSLTINALELNGNVDPVSNNSLPVYPLIEPVITIITIPDQAYGIGDTVYCNITVESNSEAGYTYDGGMVAGRTLLGFTQTGAYTYQAYFVVEEGGASFARSDAIPVENIRLYNPNGFVYGIYYNDQIIQGNDLIDADRPVIYSTIVNGGTYRVGQTVSVLVTADQSGYTFNQALTTINGIPLTSPRVNPGIVSGNQYYINYTIGEGDNDVKSGQLPASIVMEDEVSNRNLNPFTNVTGVNPIIDANSPQLTSASIIEPGVTIIGDSVEILLTFSESEITAKSGTQVNQVPLGTRVKFRRISGTQYRLVYKVYEGDQNVTAGNLTYNVVVQDAMGNESSSSLNPSNNTVSIYATRPTGYIWGGGEICEGDSLRIYANFTAGVGPWNVTIASILGTSRSFTGVSSPFSMYVKPTQTDAFFISALSDAVGNTGTGFDSEANVIVRNSTPVSILNTDLVYLRDGDPVQLLGDPSGGAFSGMGVSSGYFYPNLVHIDSTRTTIYYDFINIYGCASQAIKQFTVVEKGYEIVGLKSTICENDDPQTVSASNESGDPGSFRLLKDGTDLSSVGLSDPDPNDDMATILPDRLKRGFYDIEYSFMFNNEPYVYLSPFFLDRVESFKFTGDTNLCANNPPPELTATPNSEYNTINSHSFSGPSVDGNISTGFFFNPQKADVGYNTVFYTITSSEGCIKDTSFVIKMRDVPDADFEVNRVCIPGEGGEVAMINLTNKQDLVEQWSWTFGDINSGPDNISNLVEPVHDYTAPGSRTIVLELDTWEGCYEKVQKTYEFANKPVANFSWESDCYKADEGVVFINNSDTEFPWISHSWTIFDNGHDSLNSITMADASDMVYQFDRQDDYYIRLVCENDRFCLDTLERLLVLKPTLKITPDKSYFETFNNSNGRWDKRAEGLGISSWEYGQPDFNGFVPANLDSAWYTKFPENKPDESSWVQSPCFDLSVLERPLIRLDIMKSFDGRRDGAVLQYSENSGDTWYTVGDIGDGIEWYNGFNIINQPGGSSIGWSGSTIFNPDMEWVTSAHDLNDLIGAKNVVFRIAYATDDGSVEDNQGFAFDNIFIGERTRKTVLEHFTNSSSTVAISADDIVDKFITGPDSLDVIVLQYHTAFPGFDEMNQNNPYPPSSRSFRYGITSAPFAVLDGGVTQDLQYDFKTSFPESVDTRLISLEMAPFNLKVTADVSRTDSLRIGVRIIPQLDYGYREILLHTVIAESSVNKYVGNNGDTEFRNVVLEMLPDPAGKLYSRDWKYTDTLIQRYSWKYENVEDIEDLLVVSFLQEAATGKILQAAKWDRYYTGWPVGADRKYAVNDLRIYPNPAGDIVFVDPGRVTGNNNLLELIDITGRKVRVEKPGSGFNIILLETGTLHPGIYILNWYEDGVLKGRGSLLKTD